MAEKHSVKGMQHQKLETLHEHPRNPRKITAARFEQLKQMLAHDPLMLEARPLIALPDGTVIAGNQRLAAARALGWETIPTVVVDIDAATASEWMLRDNNPMGDWDDAAVADLLAGLPSVSATLAGFDGSDISRILAAIAPVSPVDPDDAPPVPDVVWSKLGEVYEMGAHRLMCGDATNAEHVANLLDGNVPRLCVTDPPYGVDYDPAWRTRAAKAGHLSYAARRVGEVLNDDRADWQEAWDLFPGDVLYSWHPPGATSLVHAAAIERAGFVLRMQIIWAKSNFPIGRGDYHVRHEPCWYAVRKGSPAHRTDDRTQTTLWEINLDKNVEGGHSTQKPVECMARPIRNHEPSDVYDPFCGSGTTLIACETLGRRCFAMELDRGYCDVIRNRYATYTGQPEYAAGNTQ